MRDASDGNGTFSSTTQVEDDGMNDERSRIEKREAPMERWQRRVASARSPRPRADTSPTRPPSERLRTVAEAADELGLSVYTIRSWIASRRMAHIRLGRTIRISSAELRRLVEASTVPADRT